MKKKSKGKNKYGNKKGKKPPKTVPKYVRDRFRELEKVSNITDLESEKIPYTHLWRFRKYNEEAEPLPIRKKGFRFTRNHVVTERLTNPMDVFMADYHEKAVALINLNTGVFTSAQYLIRMTIPSLCFMINHNYLYYYEKKPVKNRVKFEIMVENDPFLKRINDQILKRTSIITDINAKRSAAKKEREAKKDE